MADQQQETSSVDSKEGTSLQEEGIGKEFLSSWKSISMTDDDVMDFSFDSVSKGKKKTFNFGKLDMDFSLDGEFDKISSFKMDMSDLDFSCSPKKPTKSKENKGDISDLDFTCSPKKPSKSTENKGGDISDLDFSCSPKKPAKSKENKGGECSGGKEGRGHSFDFNFDFNEMDSFNVDTSLLKGDNTSTMYLAKKGTTSRKIDVKVAKEPGTKNNEHVHGSNVPMILKPLSSETVETLKVEIMVGDQKDPDFIQDDSVLKASSSGKLDVLVEARSSTPSAEEKEQEGEIPMKRHSSESISEDIDNPPSQSVDQNISNQDSIADQHTEVYSLGTRMITNSGGKRSVNNNKAAYADPDGVKSPLEISSSLQMKNLESSNENNSFGSNTQAEATNDPRPVDSDSSFENNVAADMSKKILPDNDIKENKNPTSEVHLATASSKPVVDEGILMKDKEIKGMQSKLFGKRGENVPLKYNSLTKGISFGCKRTGDMHLGSIIKARESFKSDDSECGTRLVSDSTPRSTKSVRDELASVDGNDDANIPTNAQKGIVSDGTQSGGKLAETKQPTLQEVKKSKTALLDTDMSSKDVNILSSHVNPSCLTETTARHANKMPVNLQAQNSEKEPLKNLRATIEENKLSSIKAVKIGFKAAKLVETDKELATPARQKKTNSPANSEHKEMRGITAAKIDHHIDSSPNQKPATPFLKRKNTNELSEADLAPLRSLKRLCHSPSEIRWRVGPTAHSAILPHPNFNVHWRLT
ncbi:uncharacterized protein At4g18490 isoform X2 [Neltuma alba]|uniref:uncharacterized protein At4g18490 isoform X2 n=1 Tax=Neltuma alba TaxID=207710 RepID=UPI0010A2AE74|nr:uncharacterized protein At4g18490 isoform X2 [Prosopis alba]